jgi:hypothetical protein
MSPLWEAVSRCLNALDWHRHGYFFSFLEPQRAANGTVILNNENGMFAVDDNMRPVKTMHCRRVLRMDQPGTQMLTHWLSSNFTTPLVITSSDELWLIPFVVGFGRKFVLNGIHEDVTVLIKAGQVLSYFFEPSNRESSSPDCNKLTMAQQELLLFLHYDYGTNENGHGLFNEELRDYFDGRRFTHIFEGIKDRYNDQMLAPVDYCRQKAGRQKAYAAFFHNLDKSGVPSSEFRKVIAHGASRYPIYRRICMFLYCEHKNEQVLDAKTLLDLLPPRKKRLWP